MSEYVCDVNVCEFNYVFICTYISLILCVCLCMYGWVVTSVYNMFLQYCIDLIKQLTGRIEWKRRRWWWSGIIRRAWWQLMQITSDTWFASQLMMFHASKQLYERYTFFNVTNRTTSFWRDFTHFCVPYTDHNRPYNMSYNKQLHINRMQATSKSSLPYVVKEETKKSRTS